MLRLILGTDWTANRDLILKRLARDVSEEKPGRILMVPEFISHDTERRLCMAAGDTASRFAEVLSFTRLANRVAATEGRASMECLDDGGRVVAMAAAARQLHSKLKAYAAVETKPEFLTALIDAIDEFKRCCISSQDLLAAAQSTQGSLAQKLEELSLLLEGYDSICARGKRDPRDRETQLLEQLEEGSFARNHVFYIDGFPDFTRQHMAILEHLIRNSPAVTVSMNCDRVGSGLLAFEKAGYTAQEILACAKRAGVPVEIENLVPQAHPLTPVRERLFQGGISQVVPGLHTYRTETPGQECLAAATHVLELVRGGCRFRDITLVCTDMTAYEGLAGLIFRRMGIPLYVSGTEDILCQSVIATVLNGLDAALGGFEQKSVLRYLRSSLSPLSPDLCDQVENYAIIWGVRGSQWTKPWDKHPDGLGRDWTDYSRNKVQQLDQAVQKAMKPLDQLRRSFLEAGKLQDQVLALYTFLQDMGLENRLLTMAGNLDAQGDNRSAQILNQLWEILISALEQLYDMLGQTKWEPEHFCRLLRLLLSQYTVGTIPPVLDAVQMGPVSAMRCHQQKHLLVLGAREGNLPGYTGSAGVLTDQERVTLRTMGVPLTGGAMEGIQAEFAEIYGVFCGAAESIRVYCSDVQPSFVFRRLSRLAGGEEKPDLTMDFALTDKWEAGAWLARWNAAEAAAQLDTQEGFLATCRGRDYSLGKVQRQNLEKLYGQTLNMSASQVDRQAECRLSYFLRYGLGAQERKEATVDPAEFGTYVHAVLENTARDIRDLGGFQQVSLEQTLDIAHKYSREYAQEQFGQLDSQRISYLFNRNLRELDMVVQELWEELKDSKFAPEDFEVAFGTEDGLPPIAIPNKGMQAILRGFIDRMDTWKTNGNTYYRVVDYKTGKKDFDYCDVFNGVGLQMLLYLFALAGSGAESLGQRPIAAGVQYFPARVPYLSCDGKQEEEDAQELRKSEWRRRGLLLQDADVLDAMDPSEDKARLCGYLKDGQPRGDLADRDQLKQLEKYVYHVLAKMVEDIASGNVEANPYTRGSVHNACTFCPYGAVCHKDTVPGRRNYKSVTAKEFWERVGKELENHG